MQAQTQVLLEILNKNARSKFGYARRFSEIKSIEHYQDCVPIHRYEELRNSISQVAVGVNQQLYVDTTLAFEFTGGSSAAEKLIPITVTGLELLQRGLLTWLYDLARHYPKITEGKMYWSVSPQTRKQLNTSGGYPIGLESDALYLGRAVACDLAPSLISTNALNNQNNIETWRWLTAYQLLANKDLNFISVWSPTYILTLFQFIQANAEELIEFVKTGHHCSMTQQFAPNPGRAKELSHAIHQSAFQLESLWPEFQLLSCWTHGGSARFIPALSKFFKRGQIQGKGLLATEGLITIPLNHFPQPILALNSGFYEFVDHNDDVHLCNDLCVGEEYRVIATFANGLYRYDMGDYVKVTGYYQQTPMLQFIGRSSLDSDVCGEKLTDAFVAQQLVNLTGFAMLAPELKPKPHYVLFLDDSHYTQNMAEQAALLVERGLRQNPQYDYARQIDQLGELRYLLINNPTERYIAWELTQGKQLGDIKPPSLRPEFNWNSRLCAT